MTVSRQSHRTGDSASATTDVAGAGPDREIAALEHAADRIRAAGLGPLALLLLESLRPLLFVGAQGLHFLKPFLGLFLDESRLERRIALLEDRRRVARFLDRLEQEGRP